MTENGFSQQILRLSLYISQIRRKVAIAGATGRVGRHVVDLLKAGGHEVVVMSRSSGVDLVTGSGLAKLLVTRRGDSVRIENVSNPADPDRDVFETGGLLPGPHTTLAGPTFEAWLDSTF